MVGPGGRLLVPTATLTPALKDAAPDDARFSPTGDASYGLQDLPLSADEARVVIAMDGTKTVGDLRTLFDSVPERTVRGL